MEEANLYKGIYTEAVRVGALVTDTHPWLLECVLEPWDGTAGAGHPETPPKQAVRKGKPENPVQTDITLLLVPDRVLIFISTLSKR